MAVKAVVVRKSLGPKGPCGFDSRPGHIIFDVKKTSGPLAQLVRAADS